MKTFTKGILITAAIVLILGIVILFTAFALNGFKLKGLYQKEKYEKHEMEIKEDIKAINIDEINGDIKFVITEDDCHVEYYDSEKIVHEISVDGDTLVIEQKDNTKWYEYLRFNFGYENDNGVIIYIPKNELREIKIETTNGDIEIKDLIISQALTTETTNGDITISNVKAGRTSFDTVNGDIKLTKLESLQNDFQTVNGDIKGTLVGRYKIDTDTVNGDVSVPKKTYGADGRINAETVNGDIDLDWDA